MKLSSDGAFPDMPHIPGLPHLRPQNVTAEQVLSEVKGLLQSARGRVHQLESCSRLGEQLGHIRSLVVDIRRSTLVLQKLRGLVEDFDGWDGPVQDTLGPAALYPELAGQLVDRGPFGVAGHHPRDFDLCQALLPLPKRTTIFGNRGGLIRRDRRPIPR